MCEFVWETLFTESCVFEVTRHATKPKLLRNREIQNYHTRRADDFSLPTQWLAISTTTPSAILCLSKTIHRSLRESQKLRPGDAATETDHLAWWTTFYNLGRI